MTLYILALETSSSLCGVALLRNSDQAISVCALEHDATAEHAERLLPMVEELLEQAGIDRSQLGAIAFGQGPGGFTGLRVACGVAQGIGYALGIPLLPIVSLLAVAARDHALVPDESCLRVVVQDARMGEVYLAAYQAAPGLGARSWKQLQEPILINAADVVYWLSGAATRWQLTQEPAVKVRLLGDALTAYPELLETIADASWLEAGPALRPDAVTIAHLGLQAWSDGEGITPDVAAPLYVRDKVAFTTLERKQGSGGNPKAKDLVVSIKPMMPEDLDEVASIEQAVQSFPWTRGNFADGLRAGYGAWIARRADQILGFCMVMFAPDVAHVLVIAVRPDSQKQGTGALLLRHCEREAKTRDLPAMVLEVRPSNENALQFYRNQGFGLLAMRKDYYPAPDGKREEACVMEKRLDGVPSK